MTKSRNKKIAAKLNREGFWIAVGNSVNIMKSTNHMSPIVSRERYVREYSNKYISLLPSYVNTVNTTIIGKYSIYYPHNGAFHKTCCLLYAFLSHDQMSCDPFATIICLVTINFNHWCIFPRLIHFIVMCRLYLYELYGFSNNYYKKSNWLFFQKLTSFNIYQLFTITINLTITII